MDRRGPRVALACLLTVGCALQLELPVDPSRAPPGSVSGRVVVSVPGQVARRPVADATVELLGTSLATRSGEDGTFLLNGILQADGRLLVRFDADGDGRPDRQRTVDLAAKGAGPGRLVALGDLAVVENARMSGRVLLGDHATEPAGHRLTTVFVPAAPFTTFTNDDGTWSLPELPEGPVQVSFFHQGYKPANLTDVVLRAGEDFVARDLVLEPDPEPPPATGAITGRLLLVTPPDSPGEGGDVASAKVAAVDTQGRLVSGSVAADGAFRIAGLAPSLYDVSASADGYASAIVRHVLVLGAAEVVLPAIALQPGNGEAACTPNDPCMLPTACRSGVIDCSTGVPACVDHGAAADGASCGGGLVCKGGECVPCVAGLACAPGQPCVKGVTSCRTGASECVATSEPLADGSSCGDGLVCFRGSCGACKAGESCDLPSSPCHVGAIDCSSGLPLCADGGSLVRNGDPCGAGLVCNGGACVACEAGGTCTPTTAPCHTGAFTCESGARVCADSGTALADGTGCGQDRVCLAGACVACVTGETCVPAAAPCHGGVSTCRSGAYECEDTGAPLADGSACGSGRVCRAGSCIVSGFTPLGGAPASARVASAANPVTVRLTDASGAPVAGAVLVVTSPEGGGAVPSNGATSSQGLFTFSPRMPRAPGRYQWTIASPADGNVVVALDAVAAATGTSYTLVNGDHGQGDDGVPGPGPQAHVGRMYDLAVAKDGTVYFTDGPYMRIRKLAPSGLVTNVAGAGRSGNAGDGGPATSALFGMPVGLALDETPGARVLYFSDYDNSLVRAIDLETGLIDTVVGGNSGAIGPAFGDGSTGRAARLANPTHLTVGPDQRLYINDRGHDRIRVYDPRTGVVDAWLTPTGGCVGEPVVLSSCGGGAGCKVVFDARGNAYVGGFYTGTATGSTCYAGAGVARRDAATGALKLVAGLLNGSNADGIPATQAGFGQAPTVAVAPSGDLVTLDESAQVLRRIEAGTGRITTLAGAWGQAGFGVEGGALKDTRFSSAFDLALLPGGDVIVADTSNQAMRHLAGVLPAATTTAKLSVESGDGQRVLVGQAAPSMLVAKLTDDTGAPLAGYLVRWSAKEPGGGVYATATRTDANGLASIRVRAGLTPGAWHFESRFDDLDGKPAAGSPATFALAAAAATAGTVRTIVNLDHSSGFDPGPVPGPMGRDGQLFQVARATDGTLYFADYDYHRVRKLSPGGELTTLAGNGQASFTGDGGRATDAALNNPVGVALDESARALYFTDYSNARVRRIRLDTGLIDTYAGGGAAPGPGFGDSGPAAQAALSNPTFLAIGPDGLLYVTDRGHDRIRRVAADGTISTWMAATGGCLNDPVVLSSCGEFGCLPAWDAAGNAYVGGLVLGTSPGSTCYATWGLVKRDADGKLTHLLGRLGGFSGDGRPGTETLLASAPIPMIDPAGNVLFTEASAHAVRRLERSTRRVTTIAGSAAGYAGDWAAFASAAFNQPLASVLDPDGRMYVPDRLNYAVRVLEGVTSAPLTTASLAAADGASQVTSLTGLAPKLFSVKLVDGAGLPMVGYTVQWQSLDAGGALYQASSQTDTAGIARVLARAGRVAGNYRFTARYTGLDGRDVTGSPASFSVKAIAPAAATVFTVVDVDRTPGSSGMPGPATLARVMAPQGLALASDGSVYFADRYFVRKLSPAGVLTNLAGSGAGGFAGDLGPATSASLDGAVGVALDATESTLFVTEASNNTLRQVDLASGIISTAVGRGPALAPGYGDSGPGTYAQLSAPTHLARGPDGALYLTDAGHQRVRRYDPTSTVITSWLTLPTGGYCDTSGAVVINDCNGGGCSVAFDAAGDAYVSATICGKPVGPQCTCTYGVVKFSPQTGAIVHVAGQYGGATSEGVAKNAGFQSPPTLFLDGNGGLVTIDQDGAKIRRIDLSSGTITTVAGSGTQGFAGDFAPAPASVWNHPFAGVLLPDGHWLLSDRDNACVRQVW